MAGSIGPLLAADEGFNHQVVETFASVGTSDPAWAEKICGMAAARDGSLQIGFGFGKYTNRNVLDAYAGICRGAEQWTVRASRALASGPETIAAGPIHYEILEPLKRVRVRLEANEHQPIAFDIVFEAIVPCVLEEREDRRDLYGVRRQTDQIRYHQTGTARGWLEVAGERTDIAPESWVATRDHSWGIRPSVGQPLADAEPDVHAMIPNVLAIWNPLLFQRPDGSYYALHHYFLHFSGPGFRHEKFQGGLEFTDGRRELLANMSPELSFDPANKRLRRGEFRFTDMDGDERLVTFHAIGDTGFHLGAGLYHGYEGHFHGSWRGQMHVEGDYYSDCRLPAAVTRLNQFRDCIIVAQDLREGAIGWGNCQTYVLGAWPAFGLSGEEPRY